MEIVKRIENIESAAIILIQETKMNESDCRSILRKIWSKGEGIAVSAEGSLGGIITWWDKSIFKCIREYKLVICRT